MPARRDWYQLEVARLRKLREELESQDDSIEILKKLRELLRRGEEHSAFIKDRIKSTRQRAAKDRLEKIALRHEIDQLIERWRSERKSWINRFVHRLTLDARTKARLKRWRQFQRTRKKK
jgi:hypothetical protein